MTQHGYIEITREVRWLCSEATGVSAVPTVPTVARVVQGFVSEETGGKVNPLLAAMGPNVGAVIGPVVVVGGVRDVVAITCEELEVHRHGFRVDLTSR